MNRILISIFGMALLAAPAAAQRVLDEIIARVNNEIILKSEFEEQRIALRESLAREFQLQGAQLDRAYAEAEADLMRNMIDQSLLIQKAEEFGISSDLEVIRTMERMRQEYSFPSLEALEAAIIEQGQSVDDFREAIRSRYLTQQVLQREVYPRIIITNEEMRNYYQDNLAQFDRPEGLRIREIVFLTANRQPAQIQTARERAAEALDRVRSGEDFTAVAAEVSESSSAAVGGELGFFESGFLSEDYERIVAPLGRSQVSEVVELADALVILQVQDRHSGGILPFELAQQEIQEALWSERVEGRIREYLTALREQGYIELRGGYVDSGAPTAARE